VLRDASVFEKQEILFNAADVYVSAHMATFANYHIAPTESEPAHSGIAHALCVIDKLSTQRRQLEHFSADQLVLAISHSMCRS
jgi:hypothetical protein